VKVKPFVCVFVLAAAVSACRKAPGTQANAATSAPGQTAPSGQPAAPAPPKPVPAQLPDVLARVNGENVRKTDFERMIQTLERQAGQPVPADRRDEIYRGALDRLVVYTLLEQEARTRGVKVTDAEIDDKVKEIKAQFQNEQAFQQAMQARGLNIDSVKQDARNDLSVNKVVEAEVAAVPGPSDAEAKEFYEKNPDKFKQDEQVRASHILVRVDPSAPAAAKQRAKTEIESVLKRAKAGADFGKLAQQHSQDGSAAQGGDLNFFQKGQMVPEFDKVAFSLQPGQLSGVVTTQFGYHIIKVTDRKPARTVPYDEAQQQIKQFLEQQKKQQRTEAFIDGLKKKSKIEILM